MFGPAQRRKLKLRMALEGPSGSGKTYTALRLAHAIANKIAVIDTEAGSSALYAGEKVDGKAWRFDLVQLEHCAPSGYTYAVEEAIRLGYECIIVDSLSHSWMGPGGALEQVDAHKSDKGGLGSYGAWRDVTPQLTKMVHTLLHAPCHVIVTMRSKMEYAITQEGGKTKIEKVGLAAVQRQGWEYEYDITAVMDREHILRVTKTRCAKIDGLVVSQPSGDMMRPIIDWLNSGTECPPPPVVEAPPPTENPPGTIPADTREEVPTARDLVEAEIKKIFKEIGAPKEKVKEVIRKRGGEKLADLHESVLNELLEKLRVTQTKVQAKKAL